MGLNDCKDSILSRLIDLSVAVMILLAVIGFMFICNTVENMMKSSGGHDMEYSITPVLSPEIYFIDGTWSIMTVDDGVYKEYAWNGSSWIPDKHLTVGLNMTSGNLKGGLVPWD